MRNKIEHGRLVLIVGPSGAGKDTLIDYARARLHHEPRIRFVRRVITRPASVAEDHEPLDPDRFQAEVERGAFALHWGAHGLHYGLPGIIDQWLAQGDVVVANGSRGIVPHARQRYKGLQLVHITAAPSILEQRLQDRGREGVQSRQARMARSDSIDVSLDDALMIDNSSDVGRAGERLVEVLWDAISRVGGR
ncbi:phosphonate metabolism protein/1,5-bisphosphokinase (PRPP-forming) PhnN [Burkholderia cepacia]|uniref:phosphonate metabolism protein/1,5-bisphosphokinase (PRPP-forming) PhnN n=1 Tax=Burkholderia cepacia TaxID=292 RepID=UPI002AB7C1C6|nr:phosphonate metabolism protein/1,5-bisphosphokinase (PRPP-forming) PhnN [Burkholderia cepacia]